MEAYPLINMKNKAKDEHPMIQFTIWIPISISIKFGLVYIQLTFSKVLAKSKVSLPELVASVPLLRANFLGLFPLCRVFTVVYEPKLFFEDDF